MAVPSAAYWIFFTVTVNRVTSWTIDLPEVRKYYFEKYENPHLETHAISRIENAGQSYDNIKGNSLHNSKEYGHEFNFNNLHISGGVNYGEGSNGNIYANSYKNYESYMIRKVQDTLNNGSAYLDGLRLSIERYIELLENCSRLNMTLNLPPEMRSPLSTGDFRGVKEFMQTCREATDASEHVRRLADLALHTTRRLQDVAHSAKYSKDASMEENELLLRLAWYLDKLAHLTGYDPDPHAHTTTAKPPTSTTPVRIPLPELSDEMKAAILGCLRDNSSRPATERCAFPVPQPVLRQLARMNNISDSSFRFDVPLPQGRVSRKSDDDKAFTSLESELLTATDNKRVFPPNSPIKVVRKRSVTDTADPLVKVLKYYAKHKVWVNSNPTVENLEHSKEKSDSYDVKNSLSPKKINKRSITSIGKVQNKIPEYPMQDISKYVKSKPNIHYNIDRKASERLRAALESIHSKKLLSSGKIKKLKKIFRYKRAYPYDHVSETFKANADIHYDIHKDVTDKLKAVVHDIHGPLKHIHGHVGHHLGHLPIHGPIEHIKAHTGLHYENIHKEEAGEKIKAAIHHLHAKKVLIQKKIETIKNILRPKRSVHYGSVVFPRIPVDPQADISYYVKNKEGTNANRDLAQAASLRLSLESVFQRGNINVVHKYGANYNPAVGAPFYAGLVQSLADS